MHILGVDPGLSGGLAIVEYDGIRCRLVRAIFMPTTGEKAKRRVDIPTTLTFLAEHPRPNHGIIERAQAMPTAGRHGAKKGEEWKGQGASSAFIYGRAVGAIEACIEGMRIPHTVIEASGWKKSHGLIKTSKEDSRQRAIKLFPEGCDFFRRKMDHNIAEAALIAWFGAMLLRGTVRENISLLPLEKSA